MTVTNRTFNPSGSAQVDTIKAAFEAIEAVIEMQCPPGRRRSVALTHLETAAMYAVKAVFEP